MTVMTPENLFLGDIDSDKEEEEEDKSDVIAASVTVSVLLCLAVVAVVAVPVLWRVIRIRRAKRSVPRPLCMLPSSAHLVPTSPTSPQTNVSKMACSVCICITVMFATKGSDYIYELLTTIAT